MESKPVLLCACNDNSVRLYDLPSFSERGKIFAKQDIRAIEVKLSDYIGKNIRFSSSTCWTLHLFAPQGKKLMSWLSEVPARHLTIESPVVMDMSGFTEKERKLAVQSLFGKVLYLSEVNAGFLTPGLMGLHVVFICWCATRRHNF
ncbi:hypothetical protein COLO4_28032 [Corchorus olitorius]|uniref:Armadillo-like repeats domain-containing protein n=1 Tax=Corchorus olitorius TaxID=93759 RepID=A0A1R3HND4_9ROSI|nr:hypothetical protein COLO4_28032 [Corchorus olitorius]